MNTVTRPAAQTHCPTQQVQISPAWDMGEHRRQKDKRQPELLHNHLPASAFPQLPFSPAVVFFTADATLYAT